MHISVAYNYINNDTRSASTETRRRLNCMTSECVTSLWLTFVCISDRCRRHASTVWRIVDVIISAGPASLCRPRRPWRPCVGVTLHRRQLSRWSIRSPAAAVVQSVHSVVSGRGQCRAWTARGGHALQVSPPVAGRSSMVSVITCSNTIMTVWLYFIILLLK